MDLTAPRAPFRPKRRGKAAFDLHKLALDKEDVRALSIGLCDQQLGGLAGHLASLR